MTTLTKLEGRFSEAEIDDEIVIMHLATGEFFSLVGTAAATWRLINGTRNRDDLIEALTEEFADHERNISKDVNDFLAQLRLLGFVGDA